MDETPHKIAGYEIERRLSAGGMGTVYLGARRGSHGFEKRVAIKLLNVEHFKRPDIHQLFVDEARLAARLSHPNICQVFDFGVDQGRYYLVMEYVEGLRVIDLLRARAERPSALPAHLAARIIADAARGLHHAHELRAPDGALLNVVHRDVSPDNIIVSYDGNTKLLDFGIARWAERASVTRHKVVRGKAAYMSPEQARSEPLDRRTDVFSLGIVLFELLTGRRLFRGEGFVDTLEAVEQQAIPDVRQLVPALDEQLAAIVGRALQREPAARFASAEELTLELERVLRHLSDVSATEALARLVQQQGQAMGLRGDMAMQQLPTEVPPESPADHPRETPLELDLTETEGNTDRSQPFKPAQRTEEIAPDALRASFAASSAPDPAVPSSTDHSSTTQLLPSASSRRRGWVVGVLGVVGLVLAVLLALYLRGSWQATGDAETSDAGSVVTAVAIDAQVSAAGADAAVRVDATRDADAAQVADAARVADTGARPRAAQPKPKPVVRRRRADAGAPVIKQAQGVGTVSIFAHPWGNVRIDGKMAGPSPLMERELSAGSHLVEVLAPDSNEVRARREITVEAGRHQKIRVRSP